MIELTHSMGVMAMEHGEHHEQDNIFTINLCDTVSTLLWQLALLLTRVCHHLWPACTKKGACVKGQDAPPLQFRKFKSLQFFIFYIFFMFFLIKSLRIFERKPFSSRCQFHFQPMHQPCSRNWIFLLTKFSTPLQKGSRSYVHIFERKDKLKK